MKLIKNKSVSQSWNKVSVNERTLIKEYMKNVLEAKKKFPNRRETSVVLIKETKNKKKNGKCSLALYYKNLNAVGPFFKISKLFYLWNSLKNLKLTNALE